MCGGPGGSLCKKPAGEPGEVSSILRLEHVHSAVRSLPLCTVACAHLEKGNFPIAHSEAVHGSAVTGVTFFGCQAEILWSQLRCRCEGYGVF